VEYDDFAGSQRQRTRDALDTERRFSNLETSVKDLINWRTQLLMDAREKVEQHRTLRYFMVAQLILMVGVLVTVLVKH
jgi:hypothetical protein